VAREVGRLDRGAKRGRDPFERFKDACMDVLCKLPGITGAQFKIAYRLLRWGNRERFEKERRFFTWPSRERLIDETNLPNSTVSDALSWLEQIGLWSDAEQGRRPGHLRQREIAASFPDKLPAHRQFKLPAHRHFKMPGHRQFGARKVPADQHFKMPNGRMENAEIGPGKCRPTGNDLLIPVEDILRAKRAGGVVPHTTKPAARLAAPIPLPFPPGERASHQADPPPGGAALRGGFAPPAGLPPDPVVPAKRLLLACGQDRDPAPEELHTLGACVREGVAEADMESAVNRFVAQRVADDPNWTGNGLALNDDEIVQRFFAARDERLALEGPPASRTERKQRRKRP
jgi:hypothetical protein